MKKRSNKIEKLLALEAAEEKRAGVATGKSLRLLEEQLAKLGELNAYRHGYADRTRGMNDVSSVHWKDYQSFLQRLDQAVVSQQQVVHDSEQNVERHRRHWLARRQRLDSLQRVLERYQAEETRFAERQQQRVLDDLPSRGNPFDDDQEG